MIITLEEHSLFEKALASRSLVKGRSAVQGKIHVYSQEDKYAITYTEEPCGKQYVYVYMPKTKQVFQVQAALPWADSLLKEEESPPQRVQSQRSPDVQQQDPSQVRLHRSGRHKGVHGSGGDRPCHGRL